MFCQISKLIHSGFTLEKCVIKLSNHLGNVTLGLLDLRFRNTSKKRFVNPNLQNSLLLLFLEVLLLLPAHADLGAI